MRNYYFKIAIMREEACKEMGSIKRTGIGEMLRNKFAAEAAEMASLGRESCRWVAIIDSCDLYFLLMYFIYCGPGSSVGIATGYGLNGPGIESRWGDEIFRTCPDRPWGPPSLLYNGYRVFPRG